MGGAAQRKREERENAKGRESARMENGSGRVEVARRSSLVVQFGRRRVSMGRTRSGHGGAVWVHARGCLGSAERCECEGAVGAEPGGVWVWAIGGDPVWLAVVEGFRGGGRGGARVWVRELRSRLGLNRGFRIRATGSRVQVRGLRFEAFGFWWRRMRVSNGGLGCGLRHVKVVAGDRALCWLSWVCGSRRGVVRRGWVWVRSGCFGGDDLQEFVRGLQRMEAGRVWVRQRIEWKLGKKEKLEQRIEAGGRG